MKNKNITKNISLLALLFINEVFIFKYSSRFFSIYQVIPMMLVFAGVAVFVSLRPPKISKKLFIGIVVAWAISLIVIWFKIPAERIEVDRWDAVCFWWQSLFDGEYPWSARTRFDGFCSPLPFFQLLYLPFVLIGEIGLLALVLVLLILFYAVQKVSEVYRSQLIFWILLSPAVLWEMVARSTIFSNSLVALVLFYFYWKKKDSANNFIIAGILSGLILSTRVNWAVPLAILFGYRVVIKKDFKWALWYPSVTVLTFLATMVPILIFWGADSIMNENPFNHQQGHMFTEFKVVLVLSTLFGIFWTRESLNKKLLFIASALFLMGLFFILQFQFDVIDSILSSKADISYLLFSYPFFVWLSMRMSKCGELGLSK